MPSFLWPWLGITAGGLAAAVLLAMYFLKLRRQEVDVPSTYLWKRLLDDLRVNAPFQRLKASLLLLLQLLIVAALALALARPVTRKGLQPGSLSVILIDQSASMGHKEDGRTRLDEAKAKARDLVDAMPTGGSAMVIAFGDTAQVVRGFTTDRAALAQAINSVSQTHRRTRLAMAYELAEAQANSFVAEQLRPSEDAPEVFLFSDGAAADLAKASLRRAKLRFQPVGRSSDRNVAVTSLNVKRNLLKPEEVQLFAKLTAWGGEPVKTDVQIRFGERAVTIRDLVVVPENCPPAKSAGVTPRETIELTQVMMGSGVIRVKQLEPDSLACDDEAVVIAPPAKALRVGLVTPGNLFLERLVSSLGVQSTKVMAPTQWEQLKPADFDVVLFDAYAPTFMPASGSFIGFGCTPPGSSLTEMPLEKGGAMAVDWQREHPILRGLNLRRLYAEDPLTWKSAPGVQVLVDGTRGPLVVTERSGQRQYLLIAFASKNSTWPSDPTFPVFFWRTVSFLALGSEMDVRPSFAPGASPRLPTGWLRDNAIKQVHLTGEGFSKVITVPEAGDFVLPGLDHVGIYGLAPAPAGFGQIAVNLLDAGESTPILGSPAEHVGLAVTDAASDSRPRRELWWWCVAAAIPLLLLEWVVFVRRLR